MTADPTPGPSSGPLPQPSPEPPFGYLDAVGGQPLLPVALPAWQAASAQAWSDPARLHHAGRRAGMILDAARASIAASLGVRPPEVFFTSSGPTAVGAAIQGLLDGAADRRVVATAVESLAVLSPARRWASDLDLVPVDRTGRLDIAAFEEVLARPTDLACVQAANAEVGTRQPLDGALALARSHGVPLLVHAVQVIGRGAVPQDWDVLCASARDWGGPAGVGILVVRPTVRWRPEENPDRGWVGGFPDIAGAAAAATALEYLQPHAGTEGRRQFALTERIRAMLPTLAAGIEVTGDPTDRLPHVVTFTCTGVTGEVLVQELDRRGISVASGSACTSDSRLPSQVLEAMGFAAEASVRVSLPYGVTDATVEAFIAALPAALAAARSGA
ncbi:MAG: aminotransferase class V-fold PLP-dependent enzyme [Actinobacteria bacterium]|nr:aminotransferase class V-fold PLP-dependent enzyme [Actinomycetota bacterium]